MLKKGKHMVYYWAFLIFIIGLFDLASLIFFFNNVCSFPFFLGFNILSYPAFVFVAKTFIRRDYGIPLYLVIFLPGLGGLIVSILYACLLYFLPDNMILGDYQRYIASNNEFNIQKQLDFEKEIRVLSFLDQINLLDTERKKELIIEFGSDNSDKRAYLLQKGLANTDHEVTHYCAVTLNSIENEYVNLIYKLREEYNQTKNIKILEKLAAELKRYIKSGLLRRDTLYFNISKEYSDVLLKLKDAKKRNSFEIDRELIEAYITTGKLNKAKELNDKIVKEYPERFEVAFNSLKIDYHSKDMDSLKEGILKLRNKKIPPEYKDQILFWAGKEI